MLQDDIKIFITHIYQYLVSEEYAQGLLVKKHSSNLLTQGDFSFLNTTKSWQEFLNCKQLQNLDSSLLKCVNKDVTNLIETSQSWEIPVVKASELKDRVHLYVNRLKSIQVCFQSSSKNNNFILSRLNVTECSTITFDSCKGTNSITNLRLKFLTDVVRNLFLINLYPQNINIRVTSKSKTDYCKNTVFCGTVLNAKTGLKENTITADEYIRIRQNELTLIAQHKYGVRVSTEAKWKEFISHLGESAVAFELLQTTCSSLVKILFDSSAGSSKGAAFILYNCARLETLIRTFNEKVNEGIYPSLPSKENTDFALLTDEDEWSLIFIYIMGLPSLLSNTVELNDNKCEFRPHLICNYLSGMVKTFSQYYRRVRILTEPRKHLLPVMYARIHLLIYLQNTLKLCLTILNIKSVSQMYIIFSYFPSSVPINIDSIFQYDKKLKNTLQRV